MCGVEDNWIINIVSNNLVMVGGQLLLCLIIYCSSKIYSLLNGTKKKTQWQWIIRINVIVTKITSHVIK
jgi:hypothetical protein